MLTVGVVGAGFMGQMHATCHSLLPNARLVGVADVEMDKATALAAKFGAQPYDCLECMIEDAKPDVIDVCLPTYMHADAVICAARLGRHVICEKPMARTVAEADQMIAAVKKAKVKFMVAHCIRFWPEYVALKGIVKSKRLGKLTSLWMSRMSPTPTWAWQNWLLDPKKSGSALLDLHIHDVDYLLFLLGKPRAVSSVSSKTKIGHSHIHTVYSYPGKAVVTCGAWDLPAGYPFTMAFRANFEKGSVVFNADGMAGLQIVEGSSKPVPAPVEKPKTEGTVSGGNISDLGGYYNELKYYIDCVDRGQHPKVVTAKDARNSLAVVLAEQRSAETGKPVKITLK